MIQKVHYYIKFHNYFTCNYQIIIDLLYKNISFLFREFRELFFLLFHVFILHVSLRIKLSVFNDPAVNSLI